MFLVFRADASVLIGTGHVMRSLAIAEEAMMRGHKCYLVGTLGGITWLEKSVSSLKIPHVENIELLPFHVFNSAVLIIDSYLISPNENSINPHIWRNVIAIADAKTPQYKVSMVIHPGLDGSWYQGNLDKFRFGPKYIPLRKKITKKKVLARKDIDKIVIFGGGTDTNSLSTVIGASLTKFKNFKVATFFSNFPEYFSNMDERFKVLPIGQELDTHLNNADLVITTSSMSSLEILAREIPCGVVCAVENQLEYHKALTSQGMAIEIGNWTENQKWFINEKNLCLFLESYTCQSELRKKTKGFIDLMGSARIVDEIQNL